MRQLTQLRLFEAAPIRLGLETPLNRSLGTVMELHKRPC